MDNLLSNLGLLAKKTSKDLYENAEVTKQMKQLQEMSKLLQNQLDSLQETGEIVADPEEELFDADIDEDDEIIEVKCKFNK